MLTTPKDLVIWDSSACPRNIKSQIMLWKGHAFDHTQPVISILQILEENADLYKKEYLAWIYNLGMISFKNRTVIEHLAVDTNASYWWSSHFSEKCNFIKMPSVYDAIAFFALRDWVDLQLPASISLETGNKRLVKVVKLLCRQKGISFEWTNVAGSDRSRTLRSFFEMIPKPVQAIFGLARYLKIHWCFRQIKLTKWYESDADVTLISFMDNLDQSELEKGNYVSRYWGSLSESLNTSNTKVNYLHLFVRDGLIKNAKDALQAVESFNSSSKNIQTHMPLASFLNTMIIFKTIISWIRLAIKARSIHHQIDYIMRDEITPWALFIDDWRESFYGRTALLNVLNAGLFSTAFRSIKKQRFGVYLQENQGYEFLLISKWREFSHGTLIGCPHFTVRFWDLRYFFDPRAYIESDALRLPLPDKVALNGKCAVDLFVDWGYPYEDIVEVEALRFEYLALELAMPHEQVAKYDTDIQRSINVLVLGEVDWVKTVSQLEMLQRAVLEVDMPIDFVFRAHPNCPIDLDQYPALKITLTGKSLLEDLLSSEVVVCGSATSAVVDAACVGKKIISILDSTNVNASPLRNSPNIAFVTSERQLADALQAFQAQPLVSFDITKTFNIDPRLPRWKALLQF